MQEGKQLGKGLVYISDLDQTYPLDEINSLDKEQFSMLLSFCDEKLLQRLYLLFEGTHKASQILLVLSKIKEG